MTFKLKGAMGGSMTYTTSWIDALIQEPQLSIEIQNGQNRHVRFTHDSDDSDYEPTTEGESSASADSDSDDSDYEPTIEDEASDASDDSDSDESDYNPTTEDEASDASDDSDSDDSDYEPTIEDESSDGDDSDSDDSDYEPTIEDESSDGDDSDSDFYASEPCCRAPTSYICTNPTYSNTFFKSIFSTSLNGKNIHTRFLYYDEPSDLSVVEHVQNGCNRETVCGSLV